MTPSTPLLIYPPISTLTFLIHYNVRYVPLYLQRTPPITDPHKATQSALIIGATGQTGRYLLQNLLSSPHFTRVGEYGRRVTAAEQITAGKDKLEQKVVDFEKIEEYGLASGKWDVVFIT